MNHIEHNPKILLGKPIIKGTRIPVEMIIRKLSEGTSKNDLLEAYPNLTTTHILAALAYAADTIAHTTNYFD